MKLKCFLIALIAMLCFDVNAQNDPTSDDWTTGTYTSTNNRVGIGTTSPAFPLHVKGSGNQTFEVESSNNQVNWSLDNSGSNVKSVRFRTFGSTKGAMRMPGGTEEIRFQQRHPDCDAQNQHGVIFIAGDPIVDALI